MGVNRRYTNTSGQPRRTYYPSGPWIDGARPPGDGAADSPKPEKKPKMQTPGNPDPQSYQVMKAQEIGNFLIILINYPDCTNYEGNKVLLYREVSLIDLINQRVIDPHFFVDPKLKSPVARFVPTDEGWEMAVALAGLLTRKACE